jgi:hypothetical protein
MQENSSENSLPSISSPVEIISVLPASEAASSIDALTLASPLTPVGFALSGAIDHNAATSILRRDWKDSHTQAGITRTLSGRQTKVAKALDAAKTIGDEQYQKVGMRRIKDSVRICEPPNTRQDSKQRLK